MKKIAIIIFGMLALWACNKTLDARIPSAPASTRDTAANIRTILAASPYTLFNKAFVRAAMDSPFAYYTIFAPSDSAMMAAGLSSAVIDTLSIDSLYKLVGYHIAVYISDTALQQDTITSRVLTLREDLTYLYSPYGGYTAQLFPQYLYVNKKGVLSLNGLYSDQGAPPLRASNGSIYPVNHVLFAPTQNLWTIIGTRPELSMYYSAYELLDSIYSGSVQAPLPVYDTVYFTYVNYAPQYSYQTIPLQLTTILAPTNTAFANAGFNTVDDIRQYLVNNPPSGAFVVTPDNPSGTYVFNYSPLDSVLKEHYFLNYNASNIFYQDMLSSPVINNGVWNTNLWWPLAYQANPLMVPHFYPQFSNHGGTVSIQWSSDPAISPLQLEMSPATTLMANNGVIYETDQLFYPHN